MFDESGERPESLRMRKLKELVDELSMMLESPEEPAMEGEPAPELDPLAAEPNAFPPKEKY